jgi:hypothetical protein
MTEEISGTLWTAGKPPKGIQMVGVKHIVQPKGTKTTIVTMSFRGWNMQQGMARIESAMKRSTLMMQCKMSDAGKYPYLYTAECHILTSVYQASPADVGG